MLAMEISSSNDETCQLDLKKLNDLVDRVKKLEAAFEEFAAKEQSHAKEIENTVKSNAEVDFWYNYVNCIESCNAKFMDNFDDTTNETPDECCKKIWDFCITVKLYNREISDWPPTDLESRKLTILLGICELEQFICGTCELFESNNEIKLPKSVQAAESENKATEVVKSDKDKSAEKEETTIENEAEATESVKTDTDSKKSANAGHDLSEETEQVADKKTEINNSEKGKNDLNTAHTTEKSSEE